MEKVRAHLVITGRVQGVCFRAACEEEANVRGLTGWVRNTDKGEVEAIIEGAKSQVESMIEWCRQGPPAARVTDIKIDWQDSKGDMVDFRIVR